MQSLCWHDSVKHAPKSKTQGPECFCLSLQGEPSSSSSVPAMPDEDTQVQSEAYMDKIAAKFRALGDFEDLCSPEGHENDQLTEQASSPKLM